jgi:hypothetical protein
MLIRGKNWWWHYFKELLFSIFKHVRGSITLAHGYSETEITLDPLIRATKIFVCVEPGEIPICAGAVDMVGAIRKSNNVFILYADIKSNTATVHWTVDYEFGPPDDV